MMDTNERTHANSSCMKESSAVACWQARQEEVNSLGHGRARLMVVTKHHPMESIIPLLEAGCRLFGENMVQEAAGKWPQIQRDLPDIQLHMIGRLQSNKLAQACEHFDAIQSIDRWNLVERLKRRQQEGRRIPDLYVQVNIAGEAQKGGADLAQAATIIEAMQQSELPVVGVMTVPPQGCPALSCYDEAARLARDHGLDQVSMGMSGDYGQALACGSTLVRIGSAIMGPRPVPAGVVRSQSESHAPK